MWRELYHQTSTVILFHKLLQVIIVKPTSMAVIQIHVIMVDVTIWLMTMFAIVKPVILELIVR